MMAIKYTDEQRQFIKDFAYGHHYEEIVNAYNDKFPDNPVIYSQIKNFCYWHKVKTGVNRGHWKKGFVPFNKGMKMEEFASKEQIKKFKQHQFKKRQDPFNKGKKQSDYMTQEAIDRTKATRFKKGIIPKNTRPVGSTRLTKEGYLEIKIAEPNKWMVKARYNWIKAHGEIPKGYSIVRIDGNPKNDDIGNLVMLSRAELLSLNCSKLMGDDVEINKSAIALAKLNAKISRKERGLE